MERANTWYSRRVQYIVLVLGFMIAFAVNADTLRMVDQMNNDEKLRKELVQSASEYVKNNPQGNSSPSKDPLDTKVKEEYHQLLNESHNLLGWENSEKEERRLFLRIAGFLLTAFAISLGSGFWFDLLKKILNIRTLGKPTQTP